MFRMCLSIAAAGLLAAAQPNVASGAQQKPARAAASKPALTSPININAASAGQLQGLPGIGASTAARIVEYRQKNGPFKKIEELMNVRGIGEKSFLKLKAQITIGATGPELATSRPEPTAPRP
jgi:competence protein ComEA